MKDIFAVYKPVGPTSHDVVERIRKMTGVKKVGHAGTLDPLAKGVLVVGIGREATKKLHEAVQKEKEYIAKIRLGATSATDDEEGEKTAIAVRRKPSAAEVRKAALGFVGSILQTPPVFSAVKIRGKEAYKRARRGEEVELKPRPVEIKKIEVLGYRWPHLRLKVTTGPGAYIRAFARDIGEKLEVGGYLAALERTRVGEFKKEYAVRLGELKAVFKKERAREW